MARWFRHYEGMNSDPCFGGVAQRCKTSRATVVFVFSSLCEMEAASAGAGYTFDAEAIADLLREEPALIKAIHADLKRIGKVASGRVLSFASRNYISDNSTERSRKHRQRKSNDNATLRNAPETETETETEKKEPSLRSGVARVPRPKASKRGLPENFPDEDARKWAEQHWLAKGRADLCALMDEEAEKFRDHHVSNAKTSADWPASWRTWCKNAMNFSKAARNGGAHQPAKILGIKDLGMDP